MQRKIIANFYIALFLFLLFPIGVVSDDVRKCGDSIRNVTGCNVVGLECRCENILSCSDDSPFTFKSPDECKMNLAVSLTHKDTSLQYDEDDDDDGKNSILLIFY